MRGRNSGGTRTRISAGMQQSVLATPRHVNFTPHRPVCSSAAFIPFKTTAFPLQQQPAKKMPARRGKGFPSRAQPTYFSLRGGPMTPDKQLLAEIADPLHPGSNGGLEMRLQPPSNRSPRALRLCPGACVHNATRRGSRCVGTVGTGVGVICFSVRLRLSLPL